MKLPFKNIGAAIGAKMDSSLGYFTGWGSGSSYDALNDQDRRKHAAPDLRSEDQILKDAERRLLTANNRDLHRNFSIAAWMIRKHLDYVSTFTFRSKTGTTALDKTIQAWMENWMLPQNCDPGGRHRFSRLVRLWEMRRVVDGDVLINRLKDGRIQTIEGDRIQSNGGVPFKDLGIDDPTTVVNGVWVNVNFRANGYMVFKRMPGWGALIFDSMVPGRFADLFGYFDRYDQVRGISPLACAINNLRDTYENVDYALAKAKISQIFAFAFYRATSEPLVDEPWTANGTPPQTPPSEPATYEERLKGVMEAKRPKLLDLDPGDKAEILESKTPSSEFQQFNEAVIAMALKSLDIPYSFYDEAHTNYSGARLAAIQYEDSAAIKRGDIETLLDKLTSWRLGLAIADGEIELPGKMTVRDLIWEWQHKGTPWYDPMKEVTGAVAAVNAGFSSTPAECKKLGVDAYDNIDEQAKFIDYAKSKGVLISTALPSPTQDDPNSYRNIQEQQQEQADSEKAGPNTGASGANGPKTIPSPQRTPDPEKK